MRILLLLILAAGSTAGQSLTWIELSGPWRMIEADNPQFAQQEFDDSGWGTIVLPDYRFFRKPASAGGQAYYFWVRRTVDLPPGLDERKLALTLGRLVENYKVYINGQEVGGAGNFTLSGSQIARPRTFDLPAIRSGKVTISIRGWVHSATGPNVWRSGADPGPYTLTDAANAPRSAGAAFFDRLRMDTTMGFASSIALIGLSVIILLVFLSQRQTELFWLSLLTAGVAFRWFQDSFSISPDSMTWASYWLLGPLNRTSFLSFLMAVLRIRARWVEISAWILTAVAYAYFDQFRLAHILVLFAIAVGFFVWTLLRRGASMSGRGLTMAATAGVLVMSMTFDIGNYANAYQLMIVWIGPYRIEYYPVALAIFAMVIVLDLTRRLLHDSAEKQRMANEMEAARVVQSLLITPSGAQSGLYGIESAYEPAQEVGGDFYQTFALNDGSSLVAVGDVSGKGLKAAMVVSLLTGALRNRKSNQPGPLLQELNGVVAGGLGGGFVTCCCLRFDAGGLVTCANAGHLAPYRNGAEAQVEPGLPLGVDPEAVYGETRFVLDAGEQVTLVSDGVLEAANAKGELFGFDRTCEISTKSAGEIAKAAKAWGQNDDITVVTVRRTPVYD